MDEVHALLGDQACEEPDRARSLHGAAACDRQRRVVRAGVGGLFPVRLSLTYDDGAPTGGNQGARDVERAAFHAAAPGETRQHLENRWHEDRPGPGQARPVSIANRRGCVELSPVSGAGPRPAGGGAGLGDFASD